MKKIFFRILIFFLFITFFHNFCFSFENNKIIRVGITDNKFSKLLYREIALKSNSNCKIYNSYSEKILELNVGDIIKFVYNNGNFDIFINNTSASKNIEGPIKIIPDNLGQIGVAGLKRNGKDAIYDGYFELVDGKTKSDLFALVNVIPLETYLRGVVPNEMPFHFELEALKAQSVAARNYVLKPRTKFYSEFDVCDSVSSQVYYGANTSHFRTNQAIDETNGLVAMYDGDLILSLYCSTHGGYSESYKNAFSINKPTIIFPSIEIPYLTSISDNPIVPKLDTEDNARWFYKNKNIQTFDNDSPYFRWEKNWDVEVLEKILKSTILKNIESGFVKPKVEKNFNIGKLKDIEVENRGESGKIISLNIIFDNIIFNIKKELIIRKIFLSENKMLPSANVIFEKIYDDNKNLIKIKAIGGGFGHGVGMSQFGAQYMAKKGYNFEEILMHYYKDIKLGTYPSYISNIDNENEYDISFYTKNRKANLIFENKFHSANILVYVNNHLCEYKLNPLSLKTEIDISKHLKSGNNLVKIVLLNDNDNNKKFSIKTYIIFKNTPNNKLW